MPRWLRGTLAEKLQGLWLRSCRDASFLMNWSRLLPFYRPEPLGKCNQNPRGAGSKVQLAGSKSTACRVSFTQESPEPVRAGAGWGDFSACSKPPGWYLAGAPGHLLSFPYCLTYIFLTSSLDLPYGKSSLLTWNLIRKSGFIMAWLVQSHCFSHLSNHHLNVEPHISLWYQDLEWFYGQNKNC